MREYLLVLLVATTVTYVLTGVVRVAGIRLGAMTAVRDRDVHKTPTPRWGGVAMFLGFAAALLTASQSPMLKNTVFQGTTIVPALLWGGGLVCLLGAIDDRWGIDALTKLAGQVFAAAVMVMQGLKITYLPIPGYGALILDPTTGVVLSVLLVVVMMNAVNFVDGLDGLAAGMTCIAALATFGYAYRIDVGYRLTGAAPGALISAILVGVCIGFLCHNWSPARIFMGDSGALLLGLLLAAAMITLTGQIDPDALTQQIGSQTRATHKLVPVYVPLMLPLTVLLLPLVDMTFAIVRRTREGRSPFSADRGHLHHRLLEIGHTQRRAVLIMYFWGALIAFLTVLFSVTPQRRPLVIGAMVFFGVGMVLLMLPWVQRRLDSRAAHRRASRRPLTRWPGVTHVNGLAPRHRRVENGHGPVPAANGEPVNGARVAGTRVDGAMTSDKTPHDTLTGF